MVNGGRRLGRKPLRWRLVLVGRNASLDRIPFRASWRANGLLPTFDEVHRCPRRNDQLTGTPAHDPNRRPSACCPQVGRPSRGWTTRADESGLTLRCLDGRDSPKMPTTRSVIHMVQRKVDLSVLMLVPRTSQGSPHRSTGTVGSRVPCTIVFTLHTREVPSNSRLVRDARSSLVGKDSRSKVTCSTPQRRGT